MIASNVPGVLPGANSYVFLFPILVIASSSFKVEDPLYTEAFSSVIYDSTRPAKADVASLACRSFSSAFAFLAAASFYFYARILAGSGGSTAPSPLINCEKAAIAESSSRAPGPLAGLTYCFSNSAATAIGF